MSVKDRLRRKLATALCPEMERNEKRYLHMRGFIADDRHWLAHDFPVVMAFATWVLDRDESYWRREGEPIRWTQWSADISAFREQLRQRFGSQAEAPTTTQPQAVS